MEKDKILELKVTELKDKLKELNLSTTGRKQTLQDRLLEHHGHEIEPDDENEIEQPYSPENANTHQDHRRTSTSLTNNYQLESEDPEDENEIEESHSLANVHIHQDTRSTNNHGRIFTLNDIRESLNYFDGVNKPEIKTWLESFEENAQAVGWDDLQKFLYAKQLIKGAAKIFLRGQSKINSWTKLRQLLLDEFGEKRSAIDIHKTLQNRRKKNNESYIEYLYSLIELGTEVNMDDHSIIEYFIDGISDTQLNKSILYDAANIPELKLKVKCYEKMKLRNDKTYTNKYNKQLSSQCTNCTHLNNHKTEECRKLNNLCYKCGKKGHKAHECRSGNRYEEPRETYRRQNDNANTNNNSNRNKQNTNRNQENNHRFQQNNNNNSGSHENDNREYFQINLSQAAYNLYINVSINGHTFKALFDTGCDLSIIRYSVFKKLNVPLLSSTKVVMNGIGKGQLETLGYIMQPVTINDQKCNLKLHIVNDSDLNLQSLIGNDILEIMNVHITNSGPTFKLKSTETTDNIVMEETLNPPESDSEFIARSEFSALSANKYIEEEENNIDTGHLEKKLQYELQNEIKNYRTQKLKSPNVNMKIILTDNIPIFHRPRRLPIDDQKFVENQIEEWLTNGIIRQSQSQYAAPVVLANKKNGKERLCIDYRKINQKIVRDNFPMTLIDDVLAKLQSAKVFTTLDLKNGFFHVPLDNDSIKYTSFVTHIGQYEFLKAPFGMTNSPAAFCRYITAIFNNLILDNTLVIYMDDIVIPAQNERENLEKLKTVLKVASEYGLQINWKKCEFIKKKINFLGYIIENSTIKPSEEKIKSVSNFPQPKDVKSLQRFLGLTSYFRRFIQNYAIIAKPLTNLLSANTPFLFNTEQEISFLQLKEALTRKPVLNIYNPHAETEVHADASKHGYGAALMQISSEDGCWHPIEYMSKKTKKYEENYHSYDLEVLAIVSALKKWRIYLLGIHFKIITDCVAFTQTIKRTEVPARITRWIIFLQDFDYKLEHRNGTKLKHVDALSRMHCYMLSRSLKHSIEQAQDQDVYISNLKKLVSGKKHPEFFIKNNLLFNNYEKELLVIPHLMETEIIETAHRQGHFGIKKTIDLIEKNFYIPDLNKKTTQIIKNCVQCIIAEAKSGRKEGFLSPIEKSDQPLHTFHIDHVGPLENTNKQYNHILTIVDAFSKFTWLYPTKSTGTHEVTNILERNSAVFGHPTRIITDKGVAFTSNNFKEYCNKNNIIHVLTTTGVPRANGQVERIHKIVISLLTKLNSENKNNWYKHLNIIQQTINNTPPRSTKISPFKIMTGIDMNIPGLSEISKLLEEEIEQEFDDNRKQIRHTAKENIIKIQNENRNNFNKKRIAGKEYQVGDIVAIKRTQFGTGLKIKPKYLGPYKITKKKRNERYEVEKLEELEGPIKTSTIGENMKPWKTAFEANT